MTKGSEVYYYRYDDNGDRIYRRTPYTTEYYLRDHLNRELAIYDPINDKAKVFNIFGNGLIGKVVTGAYENLYLTNTILEGTYEAENSITAEDNVTVTGTATLKAGNSILLKPGFTAGSGSNFTAKIGTVSTDLERFYYIKDHLGSIRVTTDETGTVVSAQDYFAYGELLRAHNSIERYKFTEKERDKETEYDYFGARYYDSELGRWLSADPFADSYPGWSSYNYALNNPYRYLDPDGKQIGGDPSDYFMARWIWGEVVVSSRQWWKEVADRYLTFTAEESVTLATIGVIARLEPTVGGEIVWGIAAGGLIGAKILDNIFSGSDDARLLMSESTKEETPDTHPEKFDGTQIKGRPAKVNKETGEVWEVDKSGHYGGKHYEVYKNKRAYEKGDRDRQVFPDGKTGKKY